MKTKYIESKALVTSRSHKLRGMLIALCLLGIVLMVNVSATSWSNNNLLNAEGYTLGGTSSDETDENSENETGESWWMSQTFTTSNSFTARNISLLIPARADSVGTLYISIRATNSSGHPTGSDLTTGTYNGDSIPVTENNSRWTTIPITSYVLSSNTKYAIIFNTKDGFGQLAWRYDSTSPTYSGGSYASSSSSGTTWTLNTAFDFLFLVSGDSLATENLTFTGNQNITRYLSIPSSVNALTKGFLNLSLIWNLSSNITNPYLLIGDYKDIKINHSIDSKCVGNFDTSQACGNATDNDISTFARVASGNTSNIIENFTLPPNVIKATFNGKYGSNLDASSQDVISCYNYTSNSYQNILTTSEVGTIYLSVILPNDCLRTGQQVLINSTLFRPSFGSGGVRDYYEGNITWDIGAFSYYKEFNQTNNRTSNLASTINRFLNATYLIGSNYLIPFVFHSDTAGILQYSDLLFSNDGFIENSQTYDLTTYETDTESYVLNLTYDNSEYTSIAGTLYYNGTSYSGTRTGSGNNAIFTRSITHEALQSSTQNKSFYWQIGLTNSSGINYYNSTTNIQTIKNITLSLCSASPVNVPFLNFTFLDETTGLNINASNDLTDFDYWIGGSSVTKDYITSNTSTNPSYAFCFDPADRTLNVDLSFKYSSSGYPQRTFQYDNQALTNTTTNKVLYLLGTGDGIYSSFQITNTAGTPISFASVVVERQFSGVWTIVGQAVSDSSGLVTFWVNPNYDHRITVIKSGYSSQTIIIRPTQSLYTIQLSSTTGNASYSPALEGILWKIYPGSEILYPNTLYTFGFNVTASLGNLVSCKFEVLLPNATILTSVSGCGTNGGNISLTFNTNGYSQIYRKFYLDTGSGYWVVDPTSNWIDATNISSFRTIKSFFESMSTLDDDLGGTEARSTFTKTLLFFFVVTILIGVLTFYTGVELTNPGVCIIIFYVFIVMASAGGWFQVSVFSVHTNSVSEWFNRFYISGLLTLFVIAFYINQWRRVNQ